MAELSTKTTTNPTAETNKSQDLSRSSIKYGSETREEYFQRLKEEYPFTCGFRGMWHDIKSLFGGDPARSFEFSGEIKKNNIGSKYSEPNFYNVPQQKRSNDAKQRQEPPNYRFLNRA